MSKNVLPEYLREDMEETEAKSTKTRRVKIDKGHAWLVRLVPAELGPRKQFFAKYSFHWINKVPVMCPKNTHVDFGGKGQDYHCPLCETAETLNNNSDDRISKIGYRASAVDQWLMYCVVFEKEYKGDSEPVSKAEMYQPHEFWMTKTTWEDIRTEITRGYKRNEKHSVLDWDNGNDFWVTAAKRGFNISREDAASIAPEKTIEDVIDRIMGSIKLPGNKVPSTEDLEDKAAKIEDYAFENGGDDDGDRGSRRGRGRSRRDDDDGGGDDDRGSRRGSRGSRDDDDDGDRGSRTSRGRSRRDDDNGGDDDRGSRDSGRSSRRGSRDDDGGGNDRQETRGRRSRDVDPDDDVPMDYDTDKDKDSGGSDVGRDDRPPSARRGERSERPARDERPARASEDENERPARSRRGSNESSVDEDDNAPEERHDPAPPYKMDEEPDKGEPAEAPPAVDAKGDTSKRQSRVSDRVKRGLNRRED